MAERFWDFFYLRSLTLYYQLYPRSQHHGFVAALESLGDELKLKRESCHLNYIRSFQFLREDPTLPIDKFIKTMTACYADESLSKFYMRSYLVNVIRESSVFHLEKESYRPRI